MSIFAKDCPQCAETNAAYAVRCKCGYSFGADDGAESQTDEEIALEEEKLYQEYLAARARQAGGTADDATTLAAAQPANQGNLNEAEQAEAGAESARAELKVQTTPVPESPTERKHAKVEPPAAPVVAQTANVEAVPPTPKPPTAKPPVQETTVPESPTERKHAKVEPPAAPVVAQTPKVASTPPAAEPPASAPPVQTTVPEGTTESKPVKVEPPIPPAATQTTNVESAPPTPKPPTAKPPVQETTVPAATTQTQAPKPSGEAEQSWLISGAESDVRFDTPTELRAVKSATTTPAKPARPTSTATDVDVTKVSAAERAKKLEQRLKEVRAKRDSNATIRGANATSKINTSAGAVKPNPDSASAAAPTTPRPPTAAAAATPVPVKDPVAPRTLPTPAAVKTDDISAPSPSKLTSMVRKLTGMVLDAKPDQPQAVDKKTTPEPKKINGTDTVPPAGDTIKVPATKEAAQSSGITATAKSDLEAALQALNTKAPETSPATPTESDNGADQADAAPEELLDTPLGDLTQKSGLGCTEKECPNCTALVPMDAESCGCGFGFPTEDDAMPSLSLTDSDVEALEKRKKSSAISHLGK